MNENLNKIMDILSDQADEMVRRASQDIMEWLEEENKEVPEIPMFEGTKEKVDKLSIYNNLTAEEQLQLEDMQNN